MVETTFADYRVDQEGKANFLENVVGEREPGKSSGRTWTFLSSSSLPLPPPE